MNLTKRVFGDFNGSIEPLEAAIIYRSDSNGVNQGGNIIAQTDVNGYFTIDTEVAATNLSITWQNVVLTRTKSDFINASEFVLIIDNELDEVVIYPDYDDVEETTEDKSNNAVLYLLIGVALLKSFS